ncbi:hypothetical protein AC249_AIPGENE15539 [Exaiptasia diaphana]|nr:hypothetical protein AC249_AIPGENE15539 [Exaiptasia diaphana]
MPNVLPETRRIPEGTKWSTNWCVRTWTEWAEERRNANATITSDLYTVVNPDVSSLSKEELAYWLSKFVVEAVPFMSVNLVGGHVSFVDNQRERRIAMFANCGKVLGLSKVLTPCIVRVTTSYEIEIIPNMKRLVIWDFEVETTDLQFVPPFSLTTYEGSDPYSSMPWLDTDSCECNCSRCTKGTVLQNMHSKEEVSQNDNDDDNNEDEQDDVNDDDENEQEVVPSEVSGDDDTDDDLPYHSSADSVELFSDTCSSSEDEKLDSDEPDNSITHTLPFKVIGVAHSLTTQDHLEKAMEKMREPDNNVQLRIVPEPDNEKDKNAISVQVNFSDEWHHVGYIASELTGYVHNILQSDLLISSQIQHIKFRVHFYRPGFYMKLLLTRQGSWEPFVLQRSKQVQ